MRRNRVPKTSQVKPNRRRGTRCATRNKRSKVRLKVGSEIMLNPVVVDTEGREVLCSLISGHLSKLDWNGQSEYFLFPEEALELLQLSAPIHYSGRFGEAILFHSKNAGWVLKSGLETKSDPIEDYLHY